MRLGSGVVRCCSLNLYIWFFCCVLCCCFWLSFLLDVLGFFVRVFLCGAWCSGFGFWVLRGGMRGWCLVRGGTRVLCADGVWLFWDGWEDWVRERVCWSGLVLCCWVFRHLVMWDFDEPESLILAQSERWRHA